MKFKAVIIFSIISCYAILSHASNSQRFEDLSQDQYTYSASTMYFPNAQTFLQKIENLKKWSKDAGIPIIGLTKNENFFRQNLHIMEPNDNILNHLDNYTINAACYTHQDVYLSIEDKTSRQKFERRKFVDDNMKANVVYYHQEENLTFRPNDPAFNNKLAKENLERYKKRIETSSTSPRICTNFIKDYIKDLELFNEKYIDQIIKGIYYLPKKIVNVMRGKAIYLTEEYGRSMTIHTASNIRKIDYLGLIPGVFMENLEGGKTILYTQLIHEVGHLVHQTVICENFFDPKINLQTIKLNPSFPEFHQYKKEIDKIFETIGTIYFDHKQHLDCFQQLDPMRSGFITYYSLENREEDFAEVFKYFILHNKYFQKLVNHRPYSKLKKLVKDETLGKKYNLMKNIIGVEGVRIDQNLEERAYTYN